MSISGGSGRKSPKTAPAQRERLGPFYLSRRPGRPNWHICWFDEETRQTRRKTTDTEDYSAAVKRLAEHFLLAEKLDRAEPASIPLWSILLRYYEEYGRLLPSAPQVKYSLKALSQHVDSLSVDDFRIPAQQRIFSALLSEGKSKSYVSRIFSVVKAALRRAYNRGELEHIPPFIPLPKAQCRDRILSVDEAVALFQAVRSESMMRYLVLAFATGARPGALLELQAEQMDFANNLIVLNPKGREQNKKRRPTLPMPALLTKMSWPVKVGPIINHHGVPYSRSGWRTMFGVIVRRAGLKGVSLYTIRHTVCTELHRRGVPPAEVAAFMGHSAVSAFGTTGNYIHYQPDYLQGAATAIDNYLRGILKTANVTLPEASKGGSGARVPAGKSTADDTDTQCSSTGSVSI